MGTVKGQKLELGILQDLSKIAGSADKQISQADTLLGQSLGYYKMSVGTINEALAMVDKGEKQMADLGIKDTQFAAAKNKLTILKNKVDSVLKKIG